MTRLISKITNIYRGIGRTFLTALGVKKLSPNTWIYGSTKLAGSIFLLGLPIGIILFGTSTTSLIVWLIIITIGLILSNLDDTYNFAKNCIKHGVDGVCTFEVPPYKE